MVIKAERKKLNKKEINKIIALFKDKLKQEKIPFQKVILFGSYAASAAHIDSDIDVAVILPQDVSRDVRQKVNDIAWWAKQINVKLEPHLLSSNDFENDFISLPAEIKKYGIVA